MIRPSTYPKMISNIMPRKKSIPPLVLLPNHRTIRSHMCEKVSKIDGINKNIDVADFLILLKNMVTVIPIAMSTIICNNFGIKPKK